MSGPEYFPSYQQTQFDLSGVGVWTNHLEPHLSKSPVDFDILSTMATAPATSYAKQTNDTPLDLLDTSENSQDQSPCPISSTIQAYSSTFRELDHLLEYPHQSSTDDDAIFNYSNTTHIPEATHATRPKDPHPYDTSIRNQELQMVDKWLEESTTEAPRHMLHYTGTTYTNFENEFAMEAAFSETGAVCEMPLDDDMDQKTLSAWVEDISARYQTASL